MNVTNSPIIVMGMHRSGTSLVIQILEKLGLFTGFDKDDNHEARFFRNINEWLLRQAGGAWDYPEPLEKFFEQDDAWLLAEEYVRELLRSPYAVRYLGFLKYLRFRSFDDLNFSWGWKDPRNTLLLPFWMKLFPDASVVYVVRNGVDVAQSIRVRQKKLLEKSKHEIKNNPSKLIRGWFRFKHSGLTNTYRCAALEDGFALWEKYMQIAGENVNRIPGQVVSIRYEDLLQDPNHVLTDICSFCNLPLGDGMIEKLDQLIDPTRAYKYKSQPELKLFAEGVHERMTRFGY